VAQYVIDSTDVIPNGMEEVTGSIPVRSTTLTPAESMSYSGRANKAANGLKHLKRLR
jgi:hypothetical protein